MEDVAEIVRLGVAQFNQRDFVGAAALARQNLSRWPDDGHLWELYGMAQRHCGDLASARDALERATCLVTLNPVAQLALADCYLQEGKTSLAREMYGYLATAGCCRPDGLLLLGNRLGKVGDYPRAVAVYRELLGREPRNHEALFGMAFALRRLGQALETILPLVAQAHEFAPEVTTYRVLLASMHAELGQKDEAYALLQDLTPTDVACRCCLHRMLTVFRMMGDDPRCQECNDQIERLEDGANGETNR